MMKPEGKGLVGGWLGWTDDEEKENLIGQVMALK